MSCSEPLIKAKKALEAINKGSSVLIIVDNDALKCDMERFVQKRGCTTKTMPAGNKFQVRITKGDSDKFAAPLTPQDYECNQGKPDLIYIIPTETLGHGDGDLGRILMKSFVKTILEVSPLPREIFFYNSGVKLTAKGSEVIEPLKELAEMGVKILSCGTCLDFYNLKKELQVGEVTNMYNIVESMITAKKTITPC